MAVILDRVKFGSMALIGLSTSALAAWAPIELPRRPASGQDVITARLVRGPEIRGTRTYFQEEPTTVRWAIAAPTADSRVGISLASARFFADTGAAPTVTTVRDALLAVFTVDQLRLIPGVTAVADGADAILFTATGGALGRLFCPVAFGPGATAPATVVVDAEVTTGNARGMLEFQAYAAGPGVDAQSLLAELISGLDSHDIAEMRHNIGLAFQGPAGDVIDLTALAGPKWESRASVRLPVSFRSYRAIAVDTIDTITMSRLVLLLDGADVGPLEFTVP